MIILYNSKYMVDAIVDGQAVMLFKLSGKTVRFVDQTILPMDAVRFPYLWWADKEADRG